MEETVEETPASEDNDVVIAPVVVNTEEKEEKAEEHSNNDGCNCDCHKEEEEKPTLADSVKENYQKRLDTVVERREEIRKEITKVKKSILKYERTEKRKERNQKMLNKRAGELTNLNLVMYSVTDIKNVDEDKKKKQSELIAHISELKASIQDADEYLDSNRIKNENDVAMLNRLTNEEERFNEEISHMEELINSTGNGEDNNQ